MFFKPLDRKLDIFLESIIIESMIIEEEDILPMIESLVIEMNEDDTDNITLAITFKDIFADRFEIKELAGNGLKTLKTLGKSINNDSNIKRLSYMTKDGKGVFRYRMNKDTGNKILNWFENNYDKENPNKPVDQVYKFQHQQSSEKQLQNDKPRKELFANSREYKSDRDYLIKNKVFKVLMSKLGKDDKVNINKLRDLQQDTGVTKDNLEQIIVRTESEKII